MENQMGGCGGGRAQALLEIQEEAGGLKKCAFHWGGGLDFFWNNPISAHLCQTSSPF